MDISLELNLYNLEYTNYNINVSINVSKRYSHPITSLDDNVIEYIQNLPPPNNSQLNIVKYY